METNRIEEINNFLNILGKIYSQNKDLEINHYIIYSLLSKYDYEEKELEYLDNDSENILISIKENFKKSKNLKTYYKKDYDNYLHLYNISNEHNNSIKIVLSFDKSHIYKCACKIFEYLDNRNFEFDGKVSNSVKSDDVIIRVFKVEDAIRILDYINNDNELSLLANLTNPFMLREGVIALTIDTKLVYSKTISYILASYIQSKSIKSYDKMNINDLIKFVKNMYDDIFTKGKTIQDFIDSKTFENERYLFDSDISEFKEYMTILEVIINQLSSSFSTNNLFSLFNKINSSDYESNQSEKIKILASKIEKKVDKISAAKEVIDKYINYSYEKNGLENTIKALSNYLDDFKYITRKNNFRTDFKKYVTKDTLLYITGEDINNYVLSILNIDNHDDEEVINKENESKVNNDIKIDNKVILNKEESIEKTLNLTDNLIINKENDELYQLFIDACKATYNKYGKEQLIKALYNAINKNIYGYFTNGDKDYRNKLINYVTIDMMKKYIITFMKENGLDSRNSTLADFYNLFADDKEL